MDFRKTFMPNKTNILLTFILFLILSSLFPIIPVSFSGSVSLPGFAAIIPTTSTRGYSNLFTAIKNFGNIESVRIVYLVVELVIVYAVSSVMVYYGKDRNVKV